MTTLLMAQSLIPFSRHPSQGPTIARLT